MGESPGPFRRIALAGAFGLLLGLLFVPPSASSQQPLDDAVGAAQSAADGAAVPGIAPPAQLDGPLEAVQELLCPPVRELAEQLEEVPVAGDAAELVSLLVCNIGQLEFSFYTVWRAPNGEEIEREHSAIIGVPTALDVDDRPGADFIGRIDFAATFDRADLVIERATSENLSFPVSIEAVIRPPGSGGKERVAFGYDEREDRAPPQFEAEVRFDGLLGGDQPTFDVRVLQRGNSQQGFIGHTTDLIAGFFDGTPGARSNQTAARIHYGAAPNRTRLALTLDDPLEALLTTSRPGPAVASLRDEDGTDSFSARAEINDLPATLGLEVGFEEPRVRYTGSTAEGGPAAIDELNLDVSSTQPIFARAHELRAAIHELTSGTELSVDQEGERVGLTTNEPIGMIEVFAGSEAEQGGDLPPAGEQGARFIDRSSEPYVLGARIFELERLEARLGERIGITARTAGGPFDLLARLEALEASAEIRDLPRRLDLDFDLEAGSVTYQGSDRIDRVGVDLVGTEPLLAAANEISLLMLDVPEAFELGIGPEGSGLAFSADNPIGEIEAKARSTGAEDESELVPDEEAGAVLRDVGGDFFLFARLFEMRELAVALDPFALHSKMQSGRVFTVDAKLEQAADEFLDDLAQALTGELAEVGEGNVVHVVATIDQLPAEVSLAVGEADPETGGTRLALSGSSPIDRVSISTEGLELLEGADHVKAEINGLPTEVSLELPEEGPLARIEANDHIGQLRLAAGDEDTQLPARSLPGADDPVLNDLFRFANVPGEFGIALRLTALTELSVNLDPVHIGLRQDAARTRVIELDAAFPSDEDVVTVEGLLNKPHTRTSVSVDLDPESAARIVFDNSANMQRFELNAQGLSGIEDVDLTFDNVSPQASICMDPGPGCQRPNPEPLSQGTHNDRPYPAEVSIDFDDLGSHGSGTGPAFHTTLNARIAFEAGDPVTITNLRYRNLSFDMGTSGSFSGTCTIGATAPRVYMFMDSGSHPFVINSIRYPAAGIRDFRIGTDGNPARAASRIAWLKGCTGFLNRNIDRETAGGLACGGQSVLNVRVLFFDVNVISWLGLCGGAVPNPQPW